jgi:hypothetical protein
MNGMTGERIPKQILQKEAETWEDLEKEATSI